MTKNTTTFALALAAATQAVAGTETWFTPLTESAVVTAPNSTEELTAPWTSPAGIEQFNIVNMRQVEDAVLGAGQSIVRVPGLSTGAAMFDMIAYDPTGDYLFIPHETANGAGVSRHAIKTRITEVLFQGDQQGVRNEGGGWGSDYGAFDPCRFTPNGTLWLAEEWSGEGRVIEVLNPFVEDPANDTEIREVHSIANVAHEGIVFSVAHPNKVVYYVDEDNSGSIYKFVMTTAGDYTEGQTFVLAVDAFAGDASANYNAGSNSGQPRTGAATWVAITDVDGNFTTTNDPFAVSFSGGRILGGNLAANEVNGTPYGRPEDAEVGYLSSGNEVLYFAATSESTVYSVEMTGANTAIVRAFASEAGTPKNDGFAPTSGIINSPDNLAQDALGNIYIIEDAPNGSSTGGDIWFCRDTNGDGVAESVDHFLSIRADGSEATGMIFNPVYPTEFVVAVQHPDSTDLTNVADGMGDAVWMFDIRDTENQLFVQFLEYAVQYPTFKSQLASYFNLINN
jgi:hypothetical protein